MPTTQETEVTIGEADVIKTALHPRARTRLAREAIFLRADSDSPHLPSVISYDPASRTLRTERVQGRSFRDVFAVDDEWHAAAMPWSAASGYLEQYVAAETDLLDRGLMYRDLNLDHLIFAGDRAVLVDHEETLIDIKEGSKDWRYRSERGTWETMAPEEFRGYGRLTERTATYRAGVLAHLALTGVLPFPRFPLRSEVHRWRRNNPPQVSPDLSLSVHGVFLAALNRRPARRQANPEAFWNALKATHEDTV